MSKHSKWETTRRAKAVTDAKRAKTFAKIARIISVAVREGRSSDPETNAKLRVAIEKAKQVNMPKANIERAIAAAQGGGETTLVDVTQELIGPSGAGIVVICQTDNKNRLLGELRTTLSKHVGALAGEHSVLWQFKKVGVITVQTNDYENLFLESVDVGAENVVNHEDGTIDVIVPFEKLDSINRRLASSNWIIQSAVPSLFPTTTVGLEESEYKKLQDLIDALEDLDDVNEIYTNGVLTT